MAWASETSKSSKLVESVGHPPVDDENLHIPVNFSQRKNPRGIFGKSPPKKAPEITK